MCPQYDVHRNIIHTAKKNQSMMFSFTSSPTKNPSPFLFCLSIASREVSELGSCSSWYFFSIAAYVRTIITIVKHVHTRRSWGVLGYRHRDLTKLPVIPVEILLIYLRTMSVQDCSCDSHKWLIAVELVTSPSA